MMEDNDNGYMLEILNELEYYYRFVNRDDNKEKNHKKLLKIIEGVSNMDNKYFKDDDYE